MACKFCEEPLPDLIDYCSQKCRKSDEFWRKEMQEKQKEESKNPDSVWLKNQQRKEAGN